MVSPVSHPVNPLLHNEKELQELLAIVGDALAFSPPLYLNAILGLPWTWFPPYDVTSEFSVLSLQNVMRAFNYLADVTIPALPLSIPPYIPLLGQAIFWRPTTVQFQPGLNNNPYSFPDEAWIFINGIVTNEPVAHINAKYLVSMFHRPMTIIQNATDSIGVDLLESVLGKAWSVHTEPAAKAYPFIHSALHNPDKKRVVVICHSQGTIIMSNVLRGLISDDYRQELREIGQRVRDVDAEHDLLPLEHADLLKKLEIYAFANVATVMTHMPGLTTAQGHPAPWIESFGNQYDLVARCGMLAPKGQERGIRIDGMKYVKEGMWGHYLNMHYLWGVNAHLSDPEHTPNAYQPQPTANGAAGRERPRLYDYYGGHTPAPY